MAKNEGPQRVSLSATQPPPPQPPPTRPTIALPPRPSMETLFTGGPGASPGPMTLVSSFFSDNYSDFEYRSFSQLLAGAMASPMAAARPSFFAENNQSDNSLKGGGLGDGVDKNSGFKQSRPMNLVVARSPLFTVPPGLSPSGLLNSPGFFSPQVIRRIRSFLIMCCLHMTDFGTCRGVSVDCVLDSGCEPNLFN